MKSLKVKKLFLEQLSKIPIIEAACRASGIVRSTFYRWRKEDDAFAAACAEALESGLWRSNDLAERNVLAKLNEGDLGASMFWLRHRHPAYSRRGQLPVFMLPPPEKGITPEEVERIRANVDAWNRNALEGVVFSGAGGDLSQDSEWSDDEQPAVAASHQPDPNAWGRKAPKGVRITDPDILPPPGLGSSARRQ